MHIAVCLKAVWRTDVPLRLDESGRGPRPEGALPILDPAARAALALALQLARPAREHARPAGVWALTVGPAAWEGLLRDALAWGVDAVLRLWPAAPGEEPSASPAWDGSAESTRAIALAAAGALGAGQALRSGSGPDNAGALPDLILAGVASQDSGAGCFGAYLAQALGIAFAHRAVQVAASPGGWRVAVKLERGYTQVLELPGPAVLTVPATLAGASLPEPDLPAWLASRTAQVPWRTCRLEAPRSRTALRPPRPRVRHIEPPSAALSAEQRIRALVSPPSPGTAAGSPATVLPPTEGAPRQAEAALRLLKEKGFVR